MGRREDQAKLRKKHKRGRYARFSGSTTKFAPNQEGRVSRVIERIEHVNEDTSRVKSIEVYVGKVSFSRQVVNGGKSSVNSERMETYYQRVRTKDQPLTVAEVFGVNNSPYQQVWDETPFENRVNFYSNDLGRLDMYWHNRVYFFVEVLIDENIMRRSREYNTAEKAKRAELYDDIRWVEQIPIKS